MKKKLGILISLFVIICGGSAYNRFMSKSVNPVSMVTERTIALNAKKQIAFKDFGENNFTCTGMTYDSKDNSFWIADYGAQSEDERLVPRLVKVDEELSKVITTIYLERLVDDKFNLQGISYDVINDTLWIATGNVVYEIDKTGSVKSKIQMGKYAEYQSNGIAVDGEQIWVLCYKKYLLKFDREGNMLHEYKFNYEDQDHVFLYKNMLYCTVGADYIGDNNFVLLFNTDTEEIKNEYRLKDSHAIEGIVIKDGCMYIANDGKFHNDIFGYSYISVYEMK